MKTIRASILIAFAIFGMYVMMCLEMSNQTGVAVAVGAVTFVVTIIGAQKKYIGG